MPGPARIPPTAWRESGDDRDTGRCDEAEQAIAVHRGEGAEKRAENLGKAIRRRHELLHASAAVFADIDLLLTPTTATTA